MGAAQGLHHADRALAGADAWHVALQDSFEAGLQRLAARRNVDHRAITENRRAHVCGKNVRGPNGRAAVHHLLAAARNGLVKLNTRHCVGSGDKMGKGKESFSFLSIGGFTADCVWHRPLVSVGIEWGKSQAGSVLCRIVVLFKPRKTFVACEQWDLEIVEI